MVCGRLFRVNHTEIVCPHVTTDELFGTSLDMYETPSLTSGCFVAINRFEMRTRRRGRYWARLYHVSRARHKSWGATTNGRLRS